MRQLYGRADKTFAEVLRETLFREIKNDFNTELFTQPLLCDELAMDNIVLAAVVGHEPLAPELAEQCGFESGQGELLAFRHLYSYDFSRMSQDVMGAVYERFLAHKLLADGGRIVIEDTDELRKKEGIYYTPRYIVDYIVGIRWARRSNRCWRKPSRCWAMGITRRARQNPRACAREGAGPGDGLRLLSAAGI